MANVLLTPTMIVRESLRVLHANLNFIGSINRTYDDKFAQTGAKIGTSFQIRKPNQFVVRQGRIIDVQDVVEESVTITNATQQGIDMSFTTAELTLSIDDFRERYIEPAMAQLASTLEAQALNALYKEVWQQVSDIGGAITWRDVLEGRAMLQNALAPNDSLRVALLNTQDNLELVDHLKNLYNDQTEIAKQYRTGVVGKTAGFTFYENTLMPRHVTGTDDGTGDYLTDLAAGQSGASIHIDTGLGTFKEGDVVYIEGVYRVHPETKENTNKLQSFVVTADYAGGEGDLKIAPPIVATGARQNVSNVAADGKKVFKVESDGTTAIGASAAHDISLLFHRDAFAFVSADLEMPQGVHFAGRAVQDGISMRIVRQYNINNDEIPCRIDVHTGFAALRPELAVRLAFN